jgi:hypothetical protein
MDFATEKITTGKELFDRILLSDGLAWIGVKIFDQLDGKTLENCDSVCELWRQFMIDNGAQLWKRQYLTKLANPGTDTYDLIKSNSELFQFEQTDQGTTFYICCQYRYRKLSNNNNEQSLKQVK